VYKRLVILSVIVMVALVGLACLGYHAVAKWAQGLEGARLGEFAEVAEQIRQDVKRKLDAFIQTEQERPYTDYLYYYVPDNVVSDGQSMPRLRSPLADQFTNSFAYGYFQVAPDSEIVTPYYQSGQAEQASSSELAAEVQQHLLNVEQNVLPIVDARRQALARASSRPEGLQEGGRPEARYLDVSDKEEGDQTQQLKGAPPRSKAYAIESLQQQAQESRIVTQGRSIVASNTATTPQVGQSAAPSITGAEQQAVRVEDEALMAESEQAGPRQRRQQQSSTPTEFQPSWAEQQAQIVVTPVEEEIAGASQDSDVVQIRIEPFVPVVVPGRQGQDAIFGGQVFLLRYVQIEDRHLLQGFQLDERRLVREVEESAEGLMREGMAFELPKMGRVEAEPNQAPEVTAYTAILDFGFGDLPLNLREMDPGWITKRIGELQHVYLGIVAVVGVAVILALASLWRTTRAQIALAQKKDEFISAVSHELRTPLTSIRMYIEMLENNWLTSKEKAGEYYRNMRQESERLTRLIENVLDFSRLQRGGKRYDFRLGDVNTCIAEVVAMMGPYAAEHGFRIETDLGQLKPISFDRDALAQIVVNLLDNAVKYARSAQDKTISVRTRNADGFAIIEVEDRGPGVPHRQRKRVFEQFYRCTPEGAGQGSPATGTGLGLSLVSRFAEAHDGFVEILSAHPQGAIFRVGLTTSM
jgi:signal transduction histidine kinase